MDCNALRRAGECLLQYPIPYYPAASTVVATFRHGQHSLLVVGNREQEAWGLENAEEGY